MRTVTLALLTGFTLVGLSTAQAADLDYGVLRGADYEPETSVIDWNGVYFGAHAGYSSASVGRSGGFQPLLADYFRERDVESQFNVSSILVAPSKRVSGESFGGFAGFNYQFDETVLGLEIDYTKFGKNASTSNSISRIYTTSDGISEVVSLNGASETRIEDYGTIRARAGYAIGNFLPFITGGLAIGRANVSDTVKVQNYGYDKKTYEANQQVTTGNPNYVYNHGYQSFNPNYPGNNSTPSGFGNQTIPAAPVPLSSGTKNKVVGGIALGAGVEYALTQNILLRGEYQYVLFNDFDSHKVNLNTIRGGAAVKF